jgi:hypothetical protein
LRIESPPNSMPNLSLICFLIAGGTHAALQ